MCSAAAMYIFKYLPELLETPGPAPSLAAGWSHGEAYGVLDTVTPNESEYLAGVSTHLIL